MKLYKDSGKKSIPRDQSNQNKEIKVADSVLLSLFIRDNGKCDIPHAPYKVGNAIIYINGLTSFIRGFAISNSEIWELLGGF